MLTVCFKLLVSLISPIWEIYFLCKMQNICLPWNCPLWNCLFWVIFFIYFSNIENLFSLQKIATKFTAPYLHIPENHSTKLTFIFFTFDFYFHFLSAILKFTTCYCVRKNLSPSALNSALRNFYFPFFSHWMGYDRGDSFIFDFEPNGIPFGSKSTGKLSPWSYPIQFERKGKYSFLRVRH